MLSIAHFKEHCFLSLFEGGGGWGGLLGVKVPKWVCDQCPSPTFPVTVGVQLQGAVHLPPKSILRRRPALHEPSRQHSSPPPPAPRTLRGEGPTSECAVLEEFSPSHREASGITSFGGMGKGGSERVENWPESHSCPVVGSPLDTLSVWLQSPGS